MDCPSSIMWTRSWGPRKKEMTQADVRRKCRTYAEKFIDIQRDEFKRLGVMGEWDNPYLTMNYAYEAVIAKECCKFALDGSLFRSKKPIHWCCSCKTALAEAEIEYHDETSPSVYVKFALKDDPSQIAEVLAGRQVSVVIWTTTPWDPCRPTWPWPCILILFTRLWKSRGKRCSYWPGSLWMIA